MCEKNIEKVNDRTFAEISNFSSKSTGEKVVKPRSGNELLQAVVTESRKVGTVQNISVTLPTSSEMISSQ